jgi:hypothetical protein
MFLFKIGNSSPVTLSIVIRQLSKPNRNSHCNFEKPLLRDESPLCARVEVSVLVAGPTSKVILVHDESTPDKKDEIAVMCAK